MNQTKLTHLKLFSFSIKYFIIYIFTTSAYLGYGNEQPFTNMVNIEFEPHPYIDNNFDILSEAQLKNPDLEPTYIIPYGNLDHQKLYIYEGMGEQKSKPVYIWNYSQGSTWKSLAKNTNAITDLNHSGVTVITWVRKHSKFNYTNFYPDTWNDADTMLNWVLDDQNATQYNLDNKNLIIAGQSLGTISSWKIAFSGHPSIKGIHLCQTPLLVQNNWLSNDINSNSPPIYLTNKWDERKDQTHHVSYAKTIVNRYNSLEINDRALLVYNIYKKYMPGSLLDGDYKNLRTSLYWGIADFVWSVIDSEPPGNPHPTATLYDNFEGSNVTYPWFTTNISWDQRDGRYFQDNLNRNKLTLAGNLNWKNYTFMVDVQTLNSLSDKNSQVAEIAFRATNRKNMYLVKLEKNGVLKLISKVNGQNNIVASYPTNSLNPFDEHQFLIDVVGNHLKVSINGELIIDTIDEQHQHGTIGLRTTKSQAVFDNVIVYVSSKVLFEDDYENGFKSEYYTMYNGEWSVPFSSLENNADTKVSTITLGEYSWKNYTASALIRTNSQKNENYNKQVGRFLFRFTDLQNHYEIYLKLDGKLYIDSVLEGNRTNLYNQSIGISPMEMHLYKVSIVDSLITVEVNGEIIEIENHDHSNGKVGLRSFKCKAEFDNLVVND